nr:E-beta-farnesene synthase [Tanacetum cinerariifolium]GEZ51654.1 E-beta-farnesene synthase [Tanacetum cinerariifolium]
MWEEFTQSIHSFVEDKKNLALHTQGKKKANHIMILSIRFTKLIIHHLQIKHKFHPRPDSSLHLPYEEYILGYLKFSAKGTKREVFRMPIPNELVTADIQGKQYNKEYLEKVAKHQRCLAYEEGSNPDSPAPKPAKATKKSNPSAPKAATVIKPAAAQQPKPKSAPAKSQEKKHEFVDEEADMQMEESLKSVHVAHRGPFPPMVIREPDSGKFQPLPEVQGKEKEKRRAPASTKPLGHAESPSIYAELGLPDSDSESDEEMPHVVKVGAQNEGQAGPNPGVLTEGQAGSNPGDDVEPQPQSSPVVHAGPNLKHMDLEATDENLKLTVEQHVILEEPAISTGTLSSLQHLAKDFSFGDIFFNDKPSKAENKKTTAETEAKSMVSVTIQQDTSAISPMTTPTAASAEYTAWTTTDTRLRLSVSSILENLHMDDDMAPDEQVHSSDDEDIRNAHIPKASSLASNYTPPPENSRLVQTVDMAIFMDWFCKQQGITELKPQDLEGPVFELVKVFHTNVIHLQYQMEECHKLLTDSVDESITKYNVSKPLPLGGPPGQVTMQSDFFFNKDLEYQRYSSKGGRPALSISKMKAAYCPDVGLEQMVPDQMWIEEECKHTSEGDRKAVRTHIRILSVVRIEVFSMYGYDYMKKIVLRRADLNEHIIAERDFKYLYPSDFEDLYLLNLQGQGIQGQQDESGFEHKVLDKERCGSKQGVQVFHSETAKDKEDLP